MNSFIQRHGAILQGCLILILLTQATAQTTNQPSAPNGAPKSPVTASRESVPQILNPDPDIGVKSLDARKKAQMETVDKFKVFYQFQFTDKVKESGITFVQHAVEDATKNYMPVHYDHGNGIAVADVDGDGLYDIYFVSQVGGNELWKNLGGGKFRNITQEAGVGVPGRISVAAAFADIDNDGDQDLFVTTVRGGNVLFENDGHGHFKDISKEAGVDLVSHSSGAVFFDYDNDGLPDLLVCNVGRYTSNEKGGDGEYVGLRDAFQGHMHPERFEVPEMPWIRVGLTTDGMPQPEILLIPNSISGIELLESSNAPTKVIAASLY